MLTTDFVTGSPAWLDLGSPDITTSAGFYGSVFGWTFESAGPDAGGYGFFQMDGRTVAAVGPLTEDGAIPAWTTYFRTPDADATAKSVEQAGGSVRAEPFDVFDAGRMAPLTDPDGVEFAIWQPAAVQGLELVSETNTLCWTELHTPNPSASLAFYNSLFGWRSQEMQMPGMTYTVLSTSEGDQQNATFGGMAEVQKGMQPRWVPYFAVADVDDISSRARSHGGSVLMAAADVPNVGRIAWIADPFKAPCAVLRPEPTTS
jgi:predicted enzyme related to lactoylglutathione lyase